MPFARSTTGACRVRNAFVDRKVERNLRLRPIRSLTHQLTGRSTIDVRTDQLQAVLEHELVKFMRCCEILSVKLLDAEAQVTDYMSCRELHRTSLARL